IRVNTEGMARALFISRNYLGPRIWLPLHASTSPRCWVNRRTVPKDGWVLSTVYSMSCRGATQGLAATPIGSTGTQGSTCPPTQSGHWLRNLWPPSFLPMEATLVDGPGGG